MEQIRLAVLIPKCLETFDHMSKTHFRFKWLLRFYIRFEQIIKSSEIKLSRSPFKHFSDIIL